MKWKLQDGKIVQSVKTLVIDGNNFSGKTLHIKNKAFLAEHDIYPFMEKYFDNQYYTSIGFTDSMVDGEIIRTHILQPCRTLKQLKKEFTKELRVIAKVMLLRANEECAYLESFEPDSPEYSEWTVYIAAVVDIWKVVKQEVKSIGDYDECIEYIRTGWRVHVPVAPDEDQPLT